MQIDTIVLGFLQTNTYIVTKDDKTIIIDPADDAQKIIEACKKLNVYEILVTHHHPDHVGALVELEKHYKIKHNTYKYALDYKVINTPGHTDDSVSYYFDKEKVLFSGDFLFKGSIGRYDFENSSFADMQKSLEMINTYDGNVAIYPGHGPKTILKDEKDVINYYLAF